MELFSSSIFQSTLPVRGATAHTACVRDCDVISIHAPRAGSDAQHAQFCATDIAFQSTLPVRGATEHMQEIPRCTFISIHAPRAGSDFAGGYPKAPGWRFQSTLPVRGATVLQTREETVRIIFQSTLPVRGATFSYPDLNQLGHISIHAPRAGSDPDDASNAAPDAPISIHAPRAGSDWHGSHSESRCILFQSTLPVRGATRPHDLDDAEMVISIHAPRAGSDVCAGRLSGLRRHFNPRSPCGERLFIVFPYHLMPSFQSTLPVRGATCQPPRHPRGASRFQSTLPVRGATVLQTREETVRIIFQSTLPVRGAT